MQENQTSIVPVEQPKQSNFLVVLLSVLLLLSVSIAGFFAYQTQRLVKEVTAYRLQIEQKPIATAEPTPDPTANWETYVNNEKGYLIKFPNTDYVRLNCMGEELTAEKYDPNNLRLSPMSIISCERDTHFNLETKTYNTILPDPSKAEYNGYDIIGSDIKMNKTDGKLYIYTYTSNDEIGPSPSWYALARAYKDNKTYEIFFGDKQKLDLFKQILSTFKFTN